MPFMREGDYGQSGTPAAKCYAFTIGYRLANGQVTPCTAQGQAGEFAFGHTVKAAVDGQGFGVSLHSHKHSGGTGVPVLAAGAMNPGDEVCVGLATYTENDGTVVTLPGLISADNAEDGDYIIGKYVGTLTITDKDANMYRPSVAWESYDKPVVKKGAVTSQATFELPVNLASVAGAGDILTDWTPGFAGKLLSYRFAVTVPVTTAAKAMTINAEINSTNVTGGVLSLTSANATPLGAVIAATPITAANEFDADDTISFEASAVTAFAEGAGILIVVYEVTPA